MKWQINRWTDAEQKQGEQLLETGWSIYAISKKLNRDQTTVRYWLDPVYRDKELARQAEKRLKESQNPKYREKQRQRIRERRQNPEYRARERIQNQNHRRELAKDPEYSVQRRKSRTVDPYLYAVWSPEAEIMKTGKSTGTDSLLSSVRSKLKRMNSVDIMDFTCIWTAPGDERHEAFVQSCLSFEYFQPFGIGKKLSEWFSTNGKTLDEIVIDLNRIYAKIPLLKTVVSEEIPEV